MTQDFLFNFVKQYITMIADHCQFYDTNILQGSVATYLRCDAKFNKQSLYYKFLIVSATEKILKMSLFVYDIAKIKVGKFKNRPKS